MSIDRDAVRAAVELYLPRTVNYARSPDLGEFDVDQAFDRIVHIILTSILVDPDSLFFTVYLSAQRLLKDVDAALEALNALDSVDQLRGISPSPPTRIEGLEKLEDAQSALLEMSAALANEVFGTTQFSKFEESINSFLAEEVVPNVKDGGNNQKASAAIRTSIQALADTWADVLERRAQVFSVVDSYDAVDLRVKVSSLVISAVRQKIAELQETLPTQSTTEHGELSEQILIELAAALASLKIIANAPSPFGTVLTGPRNDGFTEAEYLVTEGVATVEPLKPLMRGTDGKLSFDTVLVSTTGQTVDDGDTTTPSFSDTSIADLTTVLSAGQYLTLVDRGERFKISAVAIAALTLNGETLHTPATPLRFAVTETPPGTLFTSPSASFWDEYGTGATASTVLASGSQGAWLRMDKASGADGTNLKASGTDATFRPRKTSGTSGVQNLTSSDFSDVGATFLTSGVVATDELWVTGTNAGGNPYIVDTLVSETSLTITGTWGANATTSWHIEDADADKQLLLDVDVFETGITSTDSVVVLSGTQTGTYDIDSVVDASTVQFLTSFNYETGVDWEVRYPTNVFVSATGNFQSNGVVAGDVLNIDTVGIFTVVSVESQTKLTFTPAVASFFTGKSYAIYASATESTKFRQTDGADFVVLNAHAIIDGSSGILDVSGGNYPVSHRDPDAPSSTLFTTVAGFVDAGPLPWSLRAGDETDLFSDTVSAPFGSFSVGDILVYKPGTAEERRVPISQILGPTSVVLGGTLPQGETGVSYAVVSTFKPGVQLLVNGRRHDVVNVKSVTVLEVWPPLALTVGRDFEFLIVRSGGAPISYRLVDETAALGFGPSGFPSSIVGSEFEFMTGEQAKGKVTGIADIDSDLVFEAFDVNVRLKSGQRSSAYRLRTLVSETTDKFRTPGVFSSLEGDVLTVWTLDRAYTLESSVLEGPDHVLTIDGLLPARLTLQEHVVVRAGSRSHGRYLLFKHKNDQLSLDLDTSDLRLAVAEVLLDFGSNLQAITSGSGANLTFDEDGDGLTDTVSVPTADFVASGVVYGHRLDVTYPDLSVKRTYVTAVVSSTVLLVDPPLPVEASPRPWAIVRSSVSNALDDVQQLRSQLQGLRDILELYVVEQNPTVLSVTTLLKKHRMDRALDLLNDGKFTEFVEMTAEESSYSSNARAAVQSAGGATSSSSSSDTSLSGIDPTTGEPAPRQNYASANQLTSSGLEEVETRIALSKAVTDLLADERIRSMIQFSLDEARNLGIFELTGEVETGVVSDQDPTLPWLAKTGSVRDKVLARTQAALDALQYMLDHPDEFDDVGAG